MKSHRSFPTPWATAVLALCLAFSVTAFAGKPKSVEKGRDVGDGQVLYDIPFDPKHVETMLFIAPTPAHPLYEIVVPMGDWKEGASATVKSVTVNGTSCDSFYVFIDGFSHVQGAWITRQSVEARNVVLVARSLWHNDENVNVQIAIGIAGADASAREVVKEFSGRAPSTGGAPAGWNRYQSFVLNETAGLPRENEPIEFSITARAEDCRDLAKEIRLFENEAAQKSWLPVNFQIFNVQTFPGTPPGTSNPNYLQHPSQSLDMIFMANVPAHQARVYLVCYDNPAAEAWVPAPTDLKVDGPSLGARIENKHFVVKLDDRCGQIASFQIKGEGQKPFPLLTNSSSFAVHWNPDSFSDNGLWGHTFSWNPPDQTVVTTRGPLLFRVTNSGRMPESTPQVHASVTYSFYPGVPYVQCSTVTEARDPVNISAIRNGEIVLDTHLITHFVWREKTGALKTIRTLHGPNWQDEWAYRVDHDVPWIAMTNELDDYGIGEVIQSSLAFNPERGEAATHRPAFYLYYHHMWQLPLTYFTRGWVYPFSDYQRGPIIPVQAGSTYVEKMAFVPFKLYDRGKRYREIENVNERLRYPLVQRWGR